MNLIMKYAWVSVLVMLAVFGYMYSMSTGEFEGVLNLLIYTCLGGALECFSEGFVIKLLNDGKFDKVMISEGLSIFSQSTFTFLGLYFNRGIASFGYGQISYGLFMILLN